MSEPTKSRTKIFWTGLEELSVAKEAATIVQREPGVSMKDALTRAQSVLPEYRRRQLYSSAVAQLSKLTREVISKRQEQHKEATELPPALPEPTPDSIIEELAETIGQAFAELFSQALRASVTRTKAIIDSPNIPPPRKRLQRLTIVGLLPAQKNAILAEFGNTFDLRFWKDESPHTLKSLTRSSDAVIAMKDWISHGHQDLIKSVDAAKLRIVPGTVSQLERYLEGHIRKE